MNGMERRVVEVGQLEVRAAKDAESPGTIVGYAAVFNMLSVVLWGFREKIAPGAFGASLADDVRALWNHDTNHVLGRTTAGTLRLAEDAHGLKVEIDPPSSAAGWVESIRRGDVSQMSFGFRVLEDTWDEDEEGQEIRTLIKVKLYEVSPVAFPAYPDTEVGVRAFLGEDPLAQRRQLVDVRTQGLQGRKEEHEQEENLTPDPSPAGEGNKETHDDESDQRALVEVEAVGTVDAEALRAQAEARTRRLRLATA